VLSSEVVDLYLEEQAADSIGIGRGGECGSCGQCWELAGAGSKIEVAAGDNAGSEVVLGATEVDDSHTAGTGNFAVGKV
jgi:hypothetical protein